jgi:alpha-L-fucosidase
MMNYSCSFNVLAWFAFQILLLPLVIEEWMAHSAPTPTWDELDSRPLPAWYDQAKFGIFIHWGLFSVPSYGSEWFWRNWRGDADVIDGETNPYARFVQDTERPRFHYQEYAPRFRAELYRPQEWAHALAQSGAQYVVLTSKHHDGFCTWSGSVLVVCF